MLRLAAPWLVLLAIGCSMGDAVESEPEGLLPRITIEGSQFLDEAGTPVVFRGIAFSDADRLDAEGLWGARHFDAARSWGANVVRLPVHPASWRNRGEAGYLSLLEHGVGLAAHRGMYVVIDWHSIGNLRTERFTRSFYDTTWDETLSFWQTIARRFKGRPEVVLYELFNEPTQSGGDLGSLSWDQQRQMMEVLIDSVRAIDPQAQFLIAGLNWGYSLTGVVDNPVRRDRIAYVTHPYPQKRSDDPWEARWEADWGYVAQHFPVFATEFGFMGPDDPGAHIPTIADEEYGHRLIAYMEARGISWTPWCFDSQWSPQLIQDWQYTPTVQGALFRSKMLQLNGEPD